MKIKVSENSNYRNRYYYTDIKDKSTVYKGVHYRKNAKQYPYIVKACYKNKYLHIGSYSSPEIAAKIYDLFAIYFMHSPQLNVEIYPQLKSIQVPIDLIEEAQIRFKDLDGLLKGKKIDKKPRVKLSAKQLLQIRLRKEQKQNRKIKQEVLNKESLITKEMVISALKTLTIKEAVRHLNIRLPTLKSIIKEFNIIVPKNIVRTANKIGLDTPEIIIQHLKQSGSLNKLVKKLNIDRITLFSILKFNNINYKDYLGKDVQNIQICPSCNKEFNNTKESNIKIFCSSKCGKHYKEKIVAQAFREKETVKCIVCTKEFNPWTEVGGKTKFCSNQCKEEWNIKQTKKKYLSRRKIRFCRICSKEITTGSLIYCSEECRPKKPIKEKRVLWEDRYCVLCGEKFTARTCHKTRYCSRSCGNIHYMREHNIPYPGWRRGKHYKKKTNPQEKRRRALRDTYKKSKRLQGKVYSKIDRRLDLFGVKACCFCNKKLSDKDFTFEHLEPYFKTKEKFNDLNNIYCSCIECNVSKSVFDWDDWFRKQPFYSKEREYQIRYYNTLKSACIPAIKIKKKKLKPI